ncbi:hypothetical protein J3E69DRAFT_229755 [Trichoderma sp. SZMC 28015]
MTLSHDGNKAQVTKSLSAAAYVLERTAESWANIQQISGLPEALYVVGKTLPNLPILLKSLESSIKNSEETKEVKDKYAAASQFAELSQQQAKYFNLIHDAVATSDSYNKGKEYRAAAKKSGGTAIEAIMKDLLQRAKGLAAVLVTDEDLKSRLQEAYEEVAKLEPSLAEDPKGHVSLENYGAGNQFYHGGGGNQNHCSGGNQYTGDGYTINLA